MKNYIDFVADCAKNKELEKEFKNVVNSSTKLELSNWFNKKGYEVTLEESTKIITGKDQILYQKVGLY